MKLSTGYDGFLLIYDDDKEFSCYFKYEIGLKPNSKLRQVVVEMVFKEGDIVLPDMLLNFFSEMETNFKYDQVLDSKESLIFSKIMEGFKYEHAAKFV